MNIPKRLKQMCCKHNYKLFANIYNNLANDLNASTVYICKKCGKRKFDKEYIEAPVNYNNFLQDCAAYKKTGELSISPETLKNKEQYKELFGLEDLEDVWNHTLKIS